jgi:hypothetical protein
MLAAMPDEPETPRKHYQLRPREFVRVNDHPGHAAPDSDPAVRPARIEVHDLLQAANAAPPPVRATESKPARNDVQRLLRDTHDHARAAGLHELTPKTRRPSKRKRDYWIMFAAGNAALIAGTLVQPVFGGAGLIIFNLGLAWIMWFVLDDY